MAKISATDLMASPCRFSLGTLLMNVILHFGFFLAWWLSLWLLMRFQWSHALGLGFVLWLVFTLSIMPLLLAYAAGVAEARAEGLTAIKTQPGWLWGSPNAFFRGQGTVHTVC